MGTFYIIVVSLRSLFVTEPSWPPRIWLYASSRRSVWGWRSVLVIVQPDTVVRWHRQGLRLYWRWKLRVP